MGKNWLNCVSVACLSPGRDKKHQKPKKKWFGKQTSRESIEFPVEETLPGDPSSSSVTRPSPPPPPPPPPLPDFAPQPLFPPPSPPPPPPPLPARHASVSNIVYVDAKEAKNRQALALASAVAAEAAAVAAHAAAEVVRLTSSAPQIEESKEEAAAIKIQNAYRCYKARHTLRLLRGMARLKSLLQGKYVKRQMNAMLSSMQTLTRLQTQIHERRNRLFEENKTRHRLLQQAGHQKEHHQGQNLVIAGDFDSSNKSKEEIEARSVHRKEASVRRERALAYAYSHQQTWRNSSKLPHQTLMDANTPHWGWSWLERWMASRPWDPQSNDDQTSLKGSLKRENSLKTSPARSKKSASQSAIQWPINNDTKNIKSEATNRRHSIGESSTSGKDDESVGSSLSRKNSLGNTEAVKSKVSVGTTGNLGVKQGVKSKASAGTTANLGNTQAVKSKASVGTTGNLGKTQAVKSKAGAGTAGNLGDTQTLKSKDSVGTAGNVGLQQKKVLPVSDKKKPPQVVLPKKRLSSSTSLEKTKKLSDPADNATTGSANGEKKRRNGGSR